MDLQQITHDCVKALENLSYGPPVSHCYNPLIYARNAYDQYLRKFAHYQPSVLLVGMNPGPWGMGQTGIPFGEVILTRDWMGIEDRVENPSNPHPKRPVQGFACTRREVSGRRLFTWAKETYVTPDRFFKQFFVINYCPLLFFDETGKNLTPDKLRKIDREPLFNICDLALKETVRCLSIQTVVGVGKFAEKRARHALADMCIKIGSVLHPSPANPIANRGWAEQACVQLIDLGITLPNPD
jgi:single-strand selective monofunctional uracil DNA glycosylase